VQRVLQLEQVSKKIKFLKKFTLGMEKNRSSISDVIPAVLRLVHVWDKMEVNDTKAKELCFFLIHFTRLKFKYELESQVYQVL
jgi:hypothetical protein